MDTATDEQEDDALSVLPSSDSEQVMCTILPTTRVDPITGEVLEMTYG